MINYNSYHKKIDALVKEFKYKPLTKELSNKVRNFYKQFIPTFLNEFGDNNKLYSSSGTLITNGYERIVIGDYGAYVEFNDLQANDSEFEIKSGEEYRVFDNHYSKSVKYIWLTINDSSNIKIYKQNKTVKYADYKENFYNYGKKIYCYVCYG